MDILMINSELNKTNDSEQRELEQQIIKHRALYETGKPEISDAEYDRLEEGLRSISPDNVLFEQVGSEEILKESTFEKVMHEPKMLSLDKVYSIKEFFEWLPEEAQDGIVMPKIDGFAVKLVYRKRGDIFELITGATRGNGSTGEDVTENIRQVHNIPVVIPSHVIEYKNIDEFQIRGECYMRKSVFKKLNAEETGVESCRNIAPGSIRNKNPLVTRRRALSFFAYNIIGLNCKTMIDAFTVIKKAGFIPVEYKHINLHKDAEKEFIIWDKRRKDESDDFYIDGIVFMVNDINVFEELGTTSHHPRGAVAWKFKAEEAETVLRQIQWHVSRTGLINPVGIYDKVFIDGANLTNATLHNISQIRELGLGIGDRIIVARQGGVIPAIIRVEQSAGQGIQIPEKCPECNSTAVINNDNGIETLHCENKSCPAVLKAKILHFVSMMEIEDVAESMVSKLFDAGYIREPADIYTIKEKDILTFYKSGDKIVSKIINNIASSRKKSLSVFLRSLGIPLLGEKLSSDLASHFKTIENIIAASKEDLIKIEGIAEEKAASIIRGFHENEILIQNLLQYIEIISDVSLIHGTELSGKSFLITGTLSKPRKDVEGLIKNHGGTIKSSVTKTLDFLIAGDDPGSKKEKAEKIGVKIINEDELYNIINKGSSAE